MGRPSKYTPVLAERICSLIAQGKSLRKVCEMKDVPTRETVLKWLASGKYPELSDQYARACATRAEGYAEEVVEIADTESDAAIARVKIDARKWVASKLLPKVYGERQTVAHEGRVEVAATIDVSKLSDAALQELLNARRVEAD